MKVILVGAGGSGKRLFEDIKKIHEIVEFWDNDTAKIGQEIEGVPIRLPSKEGVKKADLFIISSVPGLICIKSQLLELGIGEECIITKYVEQPIIARNQFLKNFSELIYNHGIEGCCAEVGVFQGDFAREINKVFYDRKLFLFDTFEGFTKEDIEIERTNNYSAVNAGGYNMTSEELVLKKMIYKENCIIKKGFFPTTAEGMNEKFCFVNLDLDLYQPTLKGLHFFFNNNLIVDGGIVIVHDYFSSEFKGIKAAVDEFLLENKGFRIMPIGDSLSVAIIKF